jgi:DNA-binding NarL/FixJ family response regulator
VDSLHARRHAIGLLIDSGADLKLISELSSVDEALRSLSTIVEAMPDLVVVVCSEVGGEHDPLWLIRELRGWFPELPIVACGALSDRVSVSQAILAGSDGFLDLSASAEEFLNGIGRVGGGERVLVGLAAASTTPGPRSGGWATTPRLSPREREVLALAADGLTARQIAGRLGIRETTVSTHLARTYKKLGTGTRISAIKEALRLAFIPSDSDPSSDQGPKSGGGLS